MQNLQAEIRLRRDDPMELEIAIAVVELAGYRVTQQRNKKTKKERPKLNALGKPISPLYDPNYRVKTPLTSINRLLAPMPKTIKWATA